MLGVTHSEALQVLRRSVAPFLILVAPFVIFVQHQQYGFAHAEIILILLGFFAASLLLAVAARWSPRFETAALAALLTYFADIQLYEPGAKRLVLLFLVLCGVLWVIREHAARIISVGMATVVALSLLPPRPVQAVPSSTRGGGAGLPLIVHIVLDEHIGTEGLPHDLAPRGFKRETESFFVDRGFRLFGNAYSEYSSTRPSLSHLLNLTSQTVADLTVRGTADGTFRLTRNAYFTHLEQQGYVVRVHQPDYLDVCASRTASSACHTYRAASLGVLDSLQVSAFQKLLVVGGMFQARSETMGRVKGVYFSIRRGLREKNIHLPRWDWERNAVAPVAATGVLDAIATDLATSQRGELIYAHLLMPHYPYVYDAACRARPPGEWLKRNDWNDREDDGPVSNTRASRAIRYERYFEQMACVRRKVDQLIGAIPSSLRHDAIVIIQGDHGSRIGLVEPHGSRASAFTPVDYADYFSTLFAVRAPQVEAGYDLRRAAITCLLRTLVESDFRSTDKVSACSPNLVFFTDGTPHVLPEFTAPVSAAMRVSSAR